MLAPTTDEIKFPASIDSFPTVYDAESGAVSQTLTRVWAEYYNKMRNFVGVVQPLLNPKTALGDGTIDALSSVYTITPAPTIKDIIKTFYGTLAQSQPSKAPPTSILPFEFLITSVDKDYTLPGQTTPPRFVYKASQEQLNSLIGNSSFFSVRPMIQVSLSKDDPYSLYSFSDSPSRWMVNHHCYYNSTYIIVRGFIWDSVVRTPSEDGFPDLYDHWGDADSLKLNLTFMGVL